MTLKKNDEWDFADALGHFPLVLRLGHRLLSCDPPYVVGISGAWGAGKTSFLRKLWAYLGAEMEWEEGRIQTLDAACKRDEWFQESAQVFNQWSRNRKIELVWFNPWQHQFESSPLVALLQEIRQHFSFRRKFFNEIGKLTDVAVHSTLNSMTEIAKTLQIPLPSAKTVMERGREYESENFSAELGSQRFRDFFEGAIQLVTGDGGRLIIFIDDLDRCEGDVSYRLLEALKLYLNAKNCIYVLGIDQTHLETSIARTLSGEKETWRYRPLARDYLNKMFQATFLLPVPRETNTYIDQLLDWDLNFRDTLGNLFGLTVPNRTAPDWAQLVQALDRNLPHNPRKLKCFVASWKTTLDVLDVPAPGAPKLDWRLTVILQYLAQFEEPLYRRIEQFPDFYNRHLLPFCKGQQDKPHPLFDGLEIPSEEVSAHPSGALGSGASGALGTPAMGSPSAAGAVDSAGKPVPEPRFFWISRLINELAAAQVTLAADDIRRHLPQARG
jgi:KAP family P-loop domain